MSATKALGQSAEPRVSFAAIGHDSETATLEQLIHMGGDVTKPFSSTRSGRAGLVRQLLAFDAIVFKHHMS